MKKLKSIFVAAIMVIAVSNVHAQDDKKNESKIGGIRAGYHSAGIYNGGDQLAGTKALGGFYAGFFKNNKIFPMLSIQTGLEYFQNGAADNTVSDTKWKLHTLSVPVSLRFKIGPVFALGGAAANFKVGEQFYLAGEKQSIASDDKANWFDVPVFAGIGAKFLMFTVEARYHWGMLDLNDAGDRNQYFQIGAGISF